jgi:hypothetical protein
MRGGQHVQHDHAVVGDHRHPAAGAGVHGADKPEDAPVGGALSMTYAAETEFIPEARLSQLQKALLEVVWDETSRLETTLEARGEHGLLARVRYWGVEWYPSRWADRWTPADRAVVSRALRRLEQRGFVERKNERTGQPGRTTNVRLTDRGREVAKWLTK